ncbi:MAG: class I SAM-dependent methyltransferase [Rhizobiaceae bacterium]
MTDPKPLPRSSGDLTADRRADYAEMLFASADHAAAAELMLGALELAPHWVLGWFRLGEFHEAGGNAAAAVAAWRTALKLDPPDRAGARLKLELHGALPASAAPPSAFVEALFDEYAPTFDEALVGKLGYRVPELLEHAIEAGGRARFPRALDLGCGTGLMGERLRPVVDHLAGIDISAAMLRRAEARKIYDRLDKADLQSLVLKPASLDLVVAADVFMYLGGLDGIVATVARGLRSRGVFAFSVEAHDGAEAFLLRDSRRYAHSEVYVRALLSANTLRLSALERADIRMDRGAAIEGIIVTAVRP